MVSSVLAVCVAAGLALVAAPSFATASVGISRSSVIGGESIRVIGSTGIKVVRTVVLQRKSGTSWLKVTSGKSTSTGTFAFTYKPPTTTGSTRTLRVQAPKVTISGHTYATVATRSRTVTTVAQTSSATVPTTAAQGVRFTVAGTFTPTRSGRATALQHYNGTSWVTIKAGIETSTGKTTFSTSLSTLGATKLRVLAQASAGAPAKASTAKSVTVGAVTPLDSTAPPVPTKVQLVAGEGQVQVTWNAVAAADLAGYNVYLATSGGGPWTKLTDTPTNVTAYSALDLTDGAIVWFRVSAVDHVGNESAPSTAVSTVPGLSVSDLAADSMTTSSVRLTWTNPDSSAFGGVVVRRAVGTLPPATATDGTEALSTSGKASDWTDENLVAGTSYSYSVFATSTTANGYGSPATTTIAVPSEPNISGRVSDSGDSPVGGVVVDVTGPDGLEASNVLTDVDGDYEVAGLVPGNYRVCFRPANFGLGTATPGVTSECWDRTDSADNATPISVGAAPVSGIDATLPSGSALGGMASARGIGIAGVVVSIDTVGGEPRAYATTNSAGDWIVHGLDPGDYTVCFDPSNVPTSQMLQFQCFGDSGTAKSPTVVTASAGSSRTDIDISLAAVSSAPTAVYNPTKFSVAGQVTANGEISSADLVSQPCADVLFMAARGSGESGPGGVKDEAADPDLGIGGPLHTAYDEFLAHMKDGRKVTKPISIAYPADNVLPNVAELSFIHDLWQGVKEARRALTARATQCPNERIVLAGYSQGAMVVHRLLQDATTKDVGDLNGVIRSRIDASIVIADGDKIAHDTVTSFGTAKNTAQGVGTQLDGTISAALLPPGVGASTFSVCNAGDVVCDFRASATCALCRIVSGVFVHLHYAGTVAVKDAAKSAAALEQTFPSFSGSELQLTGQVGRALFHQLPATYDPTTIRSLSWTMLAGSTLPAGLALSPGGFISGIPTTDGSSVIQLSVAATGTLGQKSTSAPVQLRIDIEPTGSTAISAPMWTPQTLPLPPDATGRPAKRVDEDCADVAGRTQCLVAGAYQAADGPQGALWIFADGQWTVTRAPLPTAAVTFLGITGVSYRSSGGAGTEPGPRCGNSGQCVAFGRYLDSSGDYHAVIWTWHGGEWSVDEPDPPSDAANAPSMFITYAACGAGPLCGLTFTYTSSAGYRNFGVGIWSGTSWTFSPLSTVDHDTGDTRGISAGISCSSNACVAELDYPHVWTGGGVMLESLRTWQHGSWVEGLPDSNQYLSNVACADDFCIASAYGYLGNAWGDTIWMLQGGHWVKKTSIARPNNVWDSTIYSMSCGGALCAIKGGYGNKAFVIEGSTIQEVDPPTTSYDPVSCSAYLCATRAGLVFEPSRGYWYGPPLPKPSGTGGGIGVDCAESGCTIAGAYSSQINGQTRWTPSTWSFVNDEWILTALTPEGEGGEWDAGNTTCGAEQCLVSESYINGSGKGDLWFSSSFRPEG